MATVRGFPMPCNKFWGGKCSKCDLVIGVVPPADTPHTATIECSGPGLAGCLNSMANHKHMWSCGDEGTSPFHYYLWTLDATDPVDVYPINGKMKVKGQQVRGCILVIKLDAAPSETASPVDITQTELDSIVAANQ